MTAKKFNNLETRQSIRGKVNEHADFINENKEAIESIGDGMDKTTYDPANGSRQVAFSDEIPTLTSELTNDSGFITSAPVTSVNSKTGVVSLDTDDISEGVNKYDKIVGLLAGAGISVTGTYPDFTVTNTSPDQVVALTAGTNVSITGTYPNFTINADGGTAPVTSVNGRDGEVVGLAEANAVVDITTAQTIAGVKTFSSSPIVPTPTTDTQVANKAYVDENGGDPLSVLSDTAGITGADRVDNIVSLTQSEYDAITPDPETIYAITDGLPGTSANKIVEQYSAQFVAEGSPIVSILHYGDFSQRSRNLLDFLSNADKTLANDIYEGVELWNISNNANGNFFTFPNIGDRRLNIDIKLSIICSNPPFDKGAVVHLKRGVDGTIVDDRSKRTIFQNFSTINPGQISFDIYSLAQGASDPYYQQPLGGFGAVVENVTSSNSYNIIKIKMDCIATIQQVL